MNLVYICNNSYFSNLGMFCVFFLVNCTFCLCQTQSINCQSYMFSSINILKPRPMEHKNCCSFKYFFQQNSTIHLLYQWLKIKLNVQSRKNGTQKNQEPKAEFTKRGNKLAISCHCVPKECKQASSSAGLKLKRQLIKHMGRISTIVVQFISRCLSLFILRQLNLITQQETRSHQGQN